MKPAYYGNPIQTFILRYMDRSSMLSDSDMSKLFGINVSNFNRIKNGHTLPSTALFSRMCVELNLGRTQIYGLISDMSEYHRNRTIVPRGNATKEIMANREKECTKCKVVKPYKEFWMKTASRDGRETQCIDCKNKAK